MLTVFVASDGTGETAERVLRSALVQFENAPVKLVRRGHIRSPQQVRAVVQEAAGGDGMILHTLVSDELRRLILAESRLHGVDSMDMIGPVLDRLATRLKLTPQEKPGLFRQLGEAKSRQIEAVEFAFHHDDGQNAEELDRAEVVLVGVSRSMKTPTMLYLAYRGWFAANVPIVPQIAMPPALLALPPGRVFCLQAAAGHLLELRRTRAASTGIPTEPYASLEHIKQELFFAQELCRRHGWRSIRVTGKSVEEVSREIIALVASEVPEGGATGFVNR